LWKVNLITNANRLVGFVVAKKSPYVANRILMEEWSLKVTYESDAFCCNGSL